MRRPSRHKVIGPSIRVVFIVAVAFAVASVSAGPVQAGAPNLEPVLPAQIRLASEPGQCLDTGDPDPFDGLDSSINPCNGSLGQAWTLDASRKIRVRDKCLDVENALSDDFTPTQVWECEDVPQQLWFAESGGRVISSLNGNCLTAARIDGLHRAYTAACSDELAASQRWIVARLPFQTRVQMDRDSTFCIQADDPTTMAPCNPTADQVWTFADNGDIRHNGRCLDIRGPSDSEFAIVQLWECVDEPQQKWDLRHGGWITSRFNHKCLTSGGNLAGRGVFMVTCGGDSSHNQDWIITGPDGAGTPTEVGHAVSCLAGNGRFDTNIVNTGSAAATYRIEFEGLSAREQAVEPRHAWRMPITGRGDGSYTATVKRDGVIISDEAVEISCDPGSTFTQQSPEVQVTTACSNGLGSVRFQFVNPSSTPKPYIVEFDGVRNRSTTAEPRGANTKAVTGRPSGTYDVIIRSGISVVTTMDVVIDCAG